MYHFLSFFEFICGRENVVATPPLLVQSPRTRSKRRTDKKNNITIRQHISQKKATALYIKGHIDASGKIDLAFFAFRRNIIIIVITTVDLPRKRRREGEKPRLEKGALSHANDH